MIRTFSFNIDATKDQWEKIDSFIAKIKQNDRDQVVTGVYLSKTDILDGKLNPHFSILISTIQGGMSLDLYEACNVPDVIAEWEEENVPSHAILIWNWNGGNNA